MHKYALCILRVSTDKQTTDLQRHALQEEIATRGLKPVELDKFQSFREQLLKQDNLCVVVEDKVSGRTDKREGYQWALGQINGGWVKAVLSFRADRIGRSVKNNVAFADACLAHDVELYSLKDKVDIRSASGKLIYNILSATAQYQSEVYSENVKEGIAAKRSKAVKKFKDQHGREPSPDELNALYRHGGTSKGWTYRRVLKLLPRVYEMLDLGFSLHHIRRVTGLNYRTLRKYRDERDKEKCTRKEMNKRVYGKSDAVI